MIEEDLTSKFWRERVEQLQEEVQRLSEIARRQQIEINQQNNELLQLRQQKNIANYHKNGKDVL